MARRWAASSDLRTEIMLDRLMTQTPVPIESLCKRPAFSHPATIRRSPTKGTRQTSLSLFQQPALVGWRAASQVIFRLQQSPESV
jgi:hypothetical protein